MYLSKNKYTNHPNKQIDPHKAKKKILKKSAQAVSVGAYTAPPPHKKKGNAQIDTAIFGLLAFPNSIKPRKSANELVSSITRASSIRSDKVQGVSE